MISMSRKTARELALHIIFEMDFTGEGCDALLEKQLDADHFTDLAGEDRLYQTFPDERDAAYIRRVASGVGSHLAELDTYIGTL